jgi:hypothetical protein
MDAPAASVLRLQNRQPPAGTFEFSGGHQTCGTCSDNDNVLWTAMLGALPTRCVLNLIPQQHRATFQGPAALQRHGCDGRALVGLRLR